MSHSSSQDSLKDAQSKVLGSTSFRRRDLGSSLQPPPPASLLHHHTGSTASQHFLEKRGPQAKPKPHRVVPSFSCSSSSPHTPRKMHIASPSALPSVPPVGPAPLGRVCGRRRLSVQQKKRSYSEPDSLHEVGLSDPETAALFRRGGGGTYVLVFSKMKCTTLFAIIIRKFDLITFFIDVRRFQLLKFWWEILTGVKVKC